MATGKDLVSRVSSWLRLDEQQTQNLRHTTSEAFDRVDEALVRTTDRVRRLKHATNEAKKTFIDEYHHE